MSQWPLASCCMSCLTSIASKSHTCLALMNIVLAKRKFHMNWATFAIQKLKEGQEVNIRPRGHSMAGKVNDGDLVTLQPCSPDKLHIGDIVLVQVKGHVYLHLIKAIDQKRF